MTETWELAILATLIATTIYAIYLCILTIQHVFCTDKKRKENRGATWLTLACVICHTLNIILDPVGFYLYEIKDQDNAQNTLVYDAWSTLWTLSKLTLYLVYVYRLLIAFNHSKYAYSINVYLIIAFLWFTQSIVMVLYISVRNKFDEDSSLALIASIIFITCDFILTVVVGILFIIPISKLIRNLKNENPENSATDDSTNNNKNKKDLVAPLFANELDDADDDSVSIDDDKLIDETYEVSYFQNDSIYNCIMSKNYKELDEKARGQGDKGAVISLTGLSFDHDDTLAKTQTLHDNNHRYGSMETMRKMKKKWNLKQQTLLTLATKLGLLAMIALSSSFLYQLSWIISVAIHHSIDNLYWFTYTWSIDMVINIICLYLSFQFANKQYERYCIELCECHQFCMKIIECVI